MDVVDREGSDPMIDVRRSVGAGSHYDRWVGGSFGEGSRGDEEDCVMGWRGMEWREKDV